MVFEYLFLWLHTADFYLAYGIWTLFTVPFPSYYSVLWNYWKKLMKLICLFPYDNIALLCSFSVWIFYLLNILKIEVMLLKADENTGTKIRSGTVIRMQFLLRINLEEDSAVGLKFLTWEILDIVCAKTLFILL